MEYENPYKEYVEEADKYLLPIPRDQWIARMAARKVAWAVVEWYHAEYSLSPGDSLPPSLHDLLCRVAPD